MKKYYGIFKIVDGCRFCPQYSNVTFELCASVVFASAVHLVGMSHLCTVELKVVVKLIQFWLLIPTQL